MIEPRSVHPNVKIHLSYRAALEEMFIELCLKADKTHHAIPVLTGPTATGKSSFAMSLATRYGYEIVSADAMQIYRGFDIGTAKPTADDRARVPHHMIDILDPCESYSVASYVKETERILSHLLSEGKKPLVCGGSVQYVSALLDGLLFTPKCIDQNLRQQVNSKIDVIGVQDAWQKLHSLDPESAEAIAPTDRRRIARFFEMYIETGKTKSELNRLSRRRGPLFSFVAFHLDIEPRTALYERINKRSAIMFERGLIEETGDLMKKWPHYESCPAFRGIGYRESIDVVLGKCTEPEALDEIQKSTRRYAKRQQTWLRKRRDMIKLILEC